jgi:hypothetical protein
MPYELTGFNVYLGLLVEVEAQSFFFLYMYYNF